MAVQRGKEGKYICCCSVTKLCPTLCNSMDCSTPGLLVPHSLPEFAQTHVHWVGDAIQLSHPLLPSSPFAVNLSHHWGLFQWVSSFHHMAKALELQYQSFQWIFRVISLGIQESCKSLLQQHNSKASILQCSTFFTFQLSNFYMTTGKTIALTRWTFVGKVMSLLFKCCLGLS